jgi:hypothetical protein
MFSIQRVAEDGGAGDLRQVDADLVRAAGLQAASDEGAGARGDAGLGGEAGVGGEAGAGGEAGLGGAAGEAGAAGDGGVGGGVGAGMAGEGGEAGQAGSTGEGGSGGSLSGGSGWISSAAGGGGVAGGGARRTGVLLHAPGGQVLHPGAELSGCGHQFVVADRDATQVQVADGAARKAPELEVNEAMRGRGDGDRGPLQGLEGEQREGGTRGNHRCHRPGQGVRP